MKTRKRPLAALLAAVTSLSLAGCGKGGPANQTGSGDFQKNLHQTDEMTLVETDAGYYFAYGWLYYLDKVSGKVTLVCGKPDCDHTDENVCNGIINGYLITGGEKLYFVTNRYLNGAPNKLVHSINLDATDRKTIQQLKCDEFSSSASSSDRGIYHRGYIYYVSDDILYRVKLGGEKDSAEEIWRPENAGSTQANGGLVEFNPNAIRYTLWADGDTLYFMANVQAEGGTYKDVLFQCDLNDMSVRQVWAVPGADEVGEWETTGVKVSQWYVTNGYIYFYLAGNGLWRTELSGGKTERLADTGDKIPYGSAVYSDEYVYILNDVPGFGGDLSTPGSPFHYDGDTVFVYRPDGTFIKEISLKKLVDELGANLEMAVLMCDSTDLYFLVTTTVYSTQFGMPVGNTGSVILCRANVKTGEVTQIFNLR